MSNTPSNAEAWDLWLESITGGHHPASLAKFACAVLAKWGTPQPAAQALSDAVEHYLEAQDALDNREYGGINAEPYEKLLRRRNASRTDLDAALAAQADSVTAPAGGVVAGWQMVPIKPTHDMLCALSGEWHPSRHQPERYAAMLAASPTPLAEQQATPKAAPGVGNSGFDHQTAADFLSGKTVSDEAVRKFVAESRWAHNERAALSATLLAMHGVLTSREAEIALLKKALLEAEAAPQQEAQEPVAYAIFAENGNIRLWATEPQHVKRIAAEQGLSLVKLYTAPQPAPAPLSDDTERLNWLLWKLPGGALRYVVGELSDTSSSAEFRAAINAALAAQGGK